MNDHILRIAAWPLLDRLPGSILDEEELHHVGRIALWQHGGGQPEQFQVRIARLAMIDEIRRARWGGRAGGRRIYNGALGGSKEKSGDEFHMPRVEDLESVPEGTTDCHAASLIAVRQCIARMRSLTERQRQVLRCLVAGMQRQEVAAECGVSPARITQIVAELRERVERDLI